MSHTKRYDENGYPIQEPSRGQVIRAMIVSVCSSQFLQTEPRLVSLELVPPSYPYMVTRATLAEKLHLSEQETADHIAALCGRGTLCPFRNQHGLTFGYILREHYEDKRNIQVMHYRRLVEPFLHYLEIVEARYDPAYLKSMDWERQPLADAAEVPGDIGLHITMGTLRAILRHLRSEENQEIPGYTPPPAERHI